LPKRIISIPNTFYFSVTGGMGVPNDFDMTVFGGRRTKLFKNRGRHRSLVKEATVTIEKNLTAAIV
jgi:hypothetical protein